MMEEDPTRRKILDMVQNGDINAEEGLQLLNAFNKSSGLNFQETGYDAEAPEEIVETINIKTFSEKQVAGDDQELKKLKRRKLWWLLPFGVGLVLTIMGSFWMYTSFESKGLGWGFWLSWFPFLFGIAVMVLASLSSKAKWLHLKIHEKDKNTHINISLPLPLGVTHWVLGNWGDKIPHVRDMPVNSIIEQIQTSIDSENPLYLHVDDDDDEVEILIS